MPRAKPTASPDPRPDLVDEYVRLHKSRLKARTLVSEKHHDHEMDKVWTEMGPGDHRRALDKIRAWECGQ